MCTVEKYIVLYKMDSGPIYRDFLRFLRFGGAFLTGA